MELGLIVDGDGLRSDGTRGAPQASIPEHEPFWHSLIVMLEEATQMHESFGFEIEACGVAASHSYDARMEAARKLVGNHEALLYDLSHPQPRTQQVLERVPESSRIYADQALLECARRLLGPRPGPETHEVRCDMNNPTQANAWAMVWRYLQARIQSKPEQKPGRPPDMSPEAAASTLAVLEEIASSSLTLALKHSTPHWLMLHDSLEERESSGAPAEGAAAAHSQAAREEAARKLIGNHDRVLRDLCNPNPITNIEGRPLTQLELVRVDVGCAPYADEVLRETARRLLGRRAGLELLEVHPDPSNEAQTAAWGATAYYLCGRLQATDDERPGRTPDMPPAAAAAMKAVLREVAEPRARLDASRVWAGLELLLDQGAGFDSVADGAARPFPHKARQEAAERLLRNRHNVLADVCNPSTTLNIYGKPLTQLELVRVDPRLSAYVDELMQETVRRLLGKRAGSGALEAKLHLHNHEQRTTWHKAATYLIGRIQSAPEQKPGREPDMNFIAGNATLAVLAEVGQSALTATIAATAPHWAMLRKALGKGSTTAATREAVDLTAAGNPLQYREEAARKLIGNHVNVLCDVCNPSTTLNIYGKPLTQLELVRVDVGCAPYADEVLRETARRLLGRRAGLELLEVHPDLSNEAQTAAWGATAEYLMGRIQSTHAQRPGRTPDMERQAHAAMKEVLMQLLLQTSPWAAVRQMSSRMIQAPSERPSGVRAPRRHRQNAKFHELTRERGADEHDAGAGGEYHANDEGEYHANGEGEYHANGEGEYHANGEGEYHAEEARAVGRRGYEGGYEGGFEGGYEGGFEGGFEHGVEHGVEEGEQGEHEGEGEHEGQDEGGSPFGSLAAALASLDKAVAKGQADEGGPSDDPMQANEPMVDQFEDVLGDLASTRLEARRMLFEQAASRLSRLHAAVAPTDPRLLPGSVAPVAARAERRAERLGERLEPPPQVPPPPRAPRMVAFASNPAEVREAGLVRVREAEVKAKEAEAKAREAEAEYLNSMPQPRQEPASEHSPPSIYDTTPPKVLEPEERRPLPVAAKSVVTSVKVMSAFGWGRSRADKATK